ncbi:MAG: hypothetical protein K2X71_18940 [Methylobacterium sp.]|uniref:hypothetical protein n=1 Tax=Methylobacterium sp. TaxID=409 RepID=UPI002585BD33|nr:hypothetical protein [Methylobacterium sp.]MBY0298078.1 hypothetical protein [Methylobacterium sp.]
MANHIDRAVQALISAQEALTALSPEDRLQAGEQLAGELRKRGALKGFNLSLKEYDRSCRIDCDALSVSINAQALRQGRDDDLDADIPF